MTDQSPEISEPAESQSTEFFRTAPSVGRPPSSTSTSEQPSPSTSADPSPSPAVSSTSPDPSSSTSARAEPAPAGPAPSPGGNSPSEPAAPSSLRETIAHGLVSATTVAHNSLTDDIGRAHHLYLATEEEVHMVADSASAIIGRRIGPVAGSSEVVDVVQIAMAVASYATRTFQQWKASRTARAKVNAQTSQQPAEA